MRLIDAANVQHGSTGPWGLGHDEDARECAVALDLVDACDPAPTNLLNTDPDRSTYTVKPFGIVANLNNPVNCWRPDDEAWLRKALEAGNELALTTALVIPPVVGSENWVGAPGVSEQPLGTGAHALADATTGAWKNWYLQVLSDESYEPIMHVAPSAVGELVREGILAVQQPDGGVVSVFGCPVVVGVGYNVQPPVFFTGPLDIKLSSAELLPGSPVLAKRNRVNITATQIAEIDLAPCTVVRVGPAPLPPA